MSMLLRAPIVRPVAHAAPSRRAAICKAILLNSPTSGCAPALSLAHNVVAKASPAVVGRRRGTETQDQFYTL
jgi:hypothetical protein